MVEKQQRGDSVAEQGRQQRGREREEEEEADAEGSWLTPSRLLELVLLAGRHVDEEFDRTAADDDHHDPSDADDEEASMLTTTEKEEGKDDDLELELVDEPDEEDGEEVKAEMAEWERIRKERDPWLVVRRKEREKREGERRGLSS